MAPADKFCTGELLSLVDVFSWTETSVSIGSGLGFLWRGSTASRKPFLAFGALLTGGWEAWETFSGVVDRGVEEREVQDWLGPEDWAAGEGGAGDGAADELAVLFVLEGCTASSMPLDTRSSTALIAEFFPTNSLIPMWRRWERAWLARPFLFSNSSPQRMQMHSSDTLGRLLEDDSGGVERRLDEVLDGLFEVNSSFFSKSIGLRSSSSMTW